VTQALVRSTPHLLERIGTQPGAHTMTAPRPHTEASRLRDGQAVLRDPLCWNDAPEEPGAPGGEAVFRPAGADAPCLCRDHGWQRFAQSPRPELGVRNGQPSRDARQGPVPTDQPVFTRGQTGTPTALHGDDPRDPVLSLPFVGGHPPGVAAGITGSRMAHACSVPSHGAMHRARVAHFSSSVVLSARVRRSVHTLTWCQHIASGLILQLSRCSGQMDETRMYVLASAPHPVRSPHVVVVSDLRAETGDVRDI
jgi:hypothetical protein